MDLKEQINSIKIFDHHTHPIDAYFWMEAVGSNPFASFTAKLPVPTPLMTQRRIKSLIKIYKELFDFPYDEITPENEGELDKAYQASRVTYEAEAEIYHKVLAAGGIESVLAMCMGRPELPPGLDPKRFARAVGIDGFTIPLDNSTAGGNARQKMFIKQVEFWPNLLRKEVNPQSFADYLNMISTAMEDFQKGGGVAFKMNHAYWRDIAVDVVSEDEAADVYEKKDNAPVRYKKLQDYIIRHMLAKAGALDLPVHIHTGCAAALPQPMVCADPTRLDPFLWLPDLLNTKIVLLHGAYPFTREIGYMATRPNPPAPNIYLDVSVITWCQYSAPVSLASYLREWFGMGAAPKMLFGSDSADPANMLLSAINIREALYLALKGMIEDGLYNQSQAFMVAQMFLRDNAKELYKNAV